MRTKRRLIVGLVGVNVALLAAVMLVASTPRAHAQVVGADTDYIVVTARLASDHAALFVVDLARHALGVWQIDKTSKRFQLIGVRDLTDDFRARRPTPPPRR